MRILVVAKLSGNKLSIGQELFKGNGFSSELLTSAYDV